MDDQWEKKYSEIEESISGFIRECGDPSILASFMLMLGRMHDKAMQVVREMEQADGD